MGFYHDVIEGIAKRVGSQSEAAKRAGLGQSQVSRLLTGEQNMGIKGVAKLLDALGARLIFADERDPSREVCFVNPKVVAAGNGLMGPEQEDYYAVPLVEEAGAGAGVFPQGELRSWFLVWRHQDAIRSRHDLIAVKIARGSNSMLPTLAPGDIVLVDRQDKNADRPGRIMLVMDPDGAGKVKRVNVQHLQDERDYRLTFYSDNAAEHAPEVYSLKRDYGGEWPKAIVGRVIWAWSDVSGK